MHYKLTLGVDFALKVSIYLTSAPPFLSLCFHFPRVCLRHVCVRAHKHAHPQFLLAHTTHELTPACMYMHARVGEEDVGRDGEREEKAYTKRPFICVCVCVVCVCVQ